MNILFVYYVPSGGVETLNRQRAAALRKKKITCDFLYYTKARDLINTHDGSTFITNDDAAIKQILQNGNYDAIVITSDYIGIMRFRNLGYTGKLIFEIQGLGSAKEAKTALQAADYYINPHGDAILGSLTPHIVTILHELYPHYQTFLFHNCFDTEQFSYCSLPKQPQPIIGWVGRIEPNKNWKEFLQIGAALVKQLNVGIQLHMFEDPTLSSTEERAAFQQMIDALQIRKNLTLHANVPHAMMAEHYSRIGDSGGFLCSTSKVEGFGYAIVEAMSCLCPVLTTDSDGVRHSILHNQTGKYYEIGNISNALREATELLENSALRERIRWAALAHVKREFSPSLYCKSFLQMLKSLGVSK